MAIINEYKKGELKKAIAESMEQEFKAKVGPNVEATNKTNNDKYYSDTVKRIKNFDGGLSNTNKKEKSIKEDDNRTTLDYDFDGDPGETYKERVKSQAKGYTSKMEEENDIEKTGDFEGNENLYNTLKDAHKEEDERRLRGKKSGLAARTMPDDVFKKKSMYENSDKKMKRITFKHTIFNDEDEMQAKIPDDFKVNEMRFIMKDAAENEYLVEWIKDTAKNINEGVVVSYTNKKLFNEDLKRMKQLFNYKQSDYFGTTTAKSRVNENKVFGKTLNKLRELSKDDEE